MNAKLLHTITQRITGRQENLFQQDVEQHRTTLSERVQGKSAMVIGGAGSIGSYFIKELIKFGLRRLYVIDTNENALAELVREIRSGTDAPELEIHTYPLSFANPIFERIYTENGPFEIVANFAAHKHVRSEKDEYAMQAMFENNFLHIHQLLEVLARHQPEHFFCVSTDKATNPVSIMGATKRLMEEMVFAYQDQFKITTARFANVAFSNGSLLDSYIHRFEKQQPLVCPSDVTRYFVSLEEAGTFCLLACLLGKSGDTFLPHLSPQTDLIPFRNTLEAFLGELGITMDICETEEEAKAKAHQYDSEQSAGYPVLLVTTDTSGEKLYEEFYSEEEVVDWQIFREIGVLKHPGGKQLNLSELLQEARKLVEKPFTQRDLVQFLSRHIPEFSYADKGKSLDQKM